MSGYIDNMAGVYSAPTPETAPNVDVPAAPVYNSSAVGSSIAVQGLDPRYFQSAINYGTDLYKTGGDIDTAISGITIAGQQYQQAMSAQAGAVVDYATKVGEATKAATAVDVANAARRTATLNAAGINSDDINNRVFAAMSEINRTDAELEPLGRSIDDKMAVGIFDNPLQWLINQTQLPGMVGQYNSIARVQNRAIESAKNLQGLAGTQMNLSQMMDADAIKKAGDAKAAAEASAAAAKAEEVKASAARAAVSDIALKQSLTGQKFHTAATIAQLSESMWKSGQYANEAAANEASMDMVLRKINEYQVRIGSTLQYDKAMLKMMPPGKREALFERAGSPLIAQKFSDGLLIIHGEGDINNLANDGAAAMVGWLKQTEILGAKTANDQIKALQGQGKTLTPKEMETIHINSVNTLQDVYRGETRDLRTATDSNPYKMQYDYTMAQYLNKSRPNGHLKIKNAVVDYYAKFGPTSANKAFTKMDEAAMLDNISEGVRAGTLSAGVAAKQISDFYVLGNEMQLMSFKYPLLGLAANKGYVVKVPKMAGSILSNNVREGDTVDLTNQAMVESYLTKNVAYKALANPGLVRTLTAVPIPGQ